MSTIYYRTRNGQADYGFSFEQQGDDSFLIFIIKMPSYGSLDDTLHITHRMIFGNRYYIDWYPAPRTEDEARNAAAFWAEYTQEYIRTGRTFDVQMNEFINHQKRGVTKGKKTVTYLGDSS